MRLSVYCDFVYDLVNSRRDIYVDWFNIRVLKGRSKALIEGRVRFWDDSLLRVEEEVVERGIVSIVISYAYHYQSASGALLFRYDNSPHYPEIPTFPHHKHIVVGGSEIVEPAQPPGLSEVLREIEGLLYSQSR